MVKRKREKLEESVHEPVSAFAARRAKTEKLTNATSRSAINATPELPPNKQGSHPNPRKKRKTKGEVQPSRSSVTQDNWTAGNASKLNITESHAQVLDIPALQQISIIPDSLSETDLINGRDETDGQYLSSDSQRSIPRAASIQQLSTFIPTPDNVRGETADEWTIRLNKNDTLTLIGQYDIWVRTGAVIILGATLRASSGTHRVYAPSTHSLPSIRPLWNPYDSKHQLIEITILTCHTRIRMLRELSPKFSRIWDKKHKPKNNSVNGLDLSQRSFLFLKSSTEDLHRRPLHLLDIPNEWQSMVYKLKPNERESSAAVLICGPTGSGKSTFCRILANSMLTTPARLVSGESTGYAGVAYLDLDPGQPEYSPSGEVSLIHLRSCNLGVPFTHPIVLSPESDKLIRAHHVGRVSLKDDPGHYLQCAMDLLHHYTALKHHYSACPLIVNCSGWVLGSGLEVLTELIRLWAFTDILYTSKLGPMEVVDTLLESASKAGIPFHTLPSQSCQITTRTASDLRMMQTLSYFHLDEPEARFLRWNSSPINDIEPLVVRYSGPRQDIFGIMTIGEEQGPEYLAGILEGSVVGLVVIEDEAAIPCEGNLRQQDSAVAFSEQDTMEEDATELESTEQAQFTTLQAPGDNNSSASESDQASTDSADSSQASNFQPYPGRRKRNRPGSKDSATMRANNHFQHSSISRTAEDLPYITTGIGTNTPLDPSNSYSIGQALVRGINPATKTIHLITPVPPKTFGTLRKQNAKIVLVRGKLDTPTWAYREEYEAAAARRRRERGEEGGKPEPFGADEMRAWAEGIPWAKVVDGKERGAKVWRVRRDLRPRNFRGEDE